MVKLNGVYSPSDTIKGFIPQNKDYFKGYTNFLFGLDSILTEITYINKIAIKAGQKGLTLSLNYLNLILDNHITPNSKWVNTLKQKRGKIMKLEKLLRDNIFNLKESLKILYGKLNLMKELDQIPDDKLIYYLNVKKLIDTLETYEKYMLSMILKLTKTKNMFNNHFDSYKELKPK